MLVRQSDLKDFMRCPLYYKFKRDGIHKGESSSATSFGTALHDAVLVMEEARDLQVGLNRFKETWSDLSILDIEYDWMMPRNSHAGYADEGARILKDWWSLIQWEQDVVIAREHTFRVPMGEHELTGTCDKIALRVIKGGEHVVLLSDYKTGSKAPVRDYLRHDLQFTAYAFASTTKEFWTGIPNGEALCRDLADQRRMGEWVHLRGPRRIDAGERIQRDYNRLLYAINAMELAISVGAFVPNISGSVCEFCEFRKPCGLPTRAEEGLPE